ncbi:hypothetical protein K8I61_18510 [bacterium]|nr:hypothetical protein [bacterium]
MAEMNLRQTLSVWWSFLWRAALASAVAGAILSFFGGVLIGTVTQFEVARKVGIAIGLIASIPISVWALDSALKKKYQGFSITLVRHP